MVCEYHAHAGGMATSGLGKSDVEKRHLIGGVFAEFVAGVRDNYGRTYGPDHENVRLSSGDYCYEPQAAADRHRGPRVLPRHARGSHAAEPTWMALGQAAGTASHLAIEGGLPPRSVPIDRLQRMLEAAGQVVRHPGRVEA